MTTCRDCGWVGSVTGVCPRCGAFARTEGRGWVCFPCGAQNLVAEAPDGRCVCGRARAVECAACEAEVPLAASACPECGVPKYAFATTEQGLERTMAIQLQRARAKTVGLAVAPMALVGVLLLAASGSRNLRLLGGGLLACALAGMAHSTATERRTRRFIH